MAGSFVPTGSFSNLTRVQLEQLRKADFFAGSKALTVGDSGVNNDGTSFTAVGPGNINAEQFFTQQSTLLDDVYGLTPDPSPGPGVITESQIGGLIQSETTQWYGPTRITNGIAHGFTATSIVGGPGAFISVHAGDILLIKQPTGTSLGD